MLLLKQIAQRSVVLGSWMVRESLLSLLELRASGTYVAVAQEKNISEVDMTGRAGQSVAGIEGKRGVDVVKGGVPTSSGLDQMLFLDVQVPVGPLHAVRPAAVEPQEFGDMQAPEAMGQTDEKIVVTLDHEVRVEASQGHVDGAPPHGLRAEKLSCQGLPEAAWGEDIGRPRAVSLEGLMGGVRDEAVRIDHAHMGVRVEGRRKRLKSVRSMPVIGVGVGEVASPRLGSAPVPCAIEGFPLFGALVDNVRMVLLEAPDDATLVLRRTAVDNDDLQLPALIKALPSQVTEAAFEERFGIVGGNYGGDPIERQVATPTARLLIHG